MKVIIAGCGKFGKLLTRELTKENHDITVIDPKPGLVEDIVDQFDVYGYCGNAASYDTQLEAGVDKADIFVSCSPSDETNILCCLVAKKLGVKQTIARLRNPEYAKQVQIMQNELGVDLTLNPDLDTAEEIFRILRFPSATKVETFANGRVNLIEIKIEKGSTLANKTLADIRLKLNVPILVCAVERGDDVIIPKGNFTLLEDDVVYITADNKQITDAFKKLKLFKNTLKSSIIIGGGRISYYLADLLINSGISVKIIEKDLKTCHLLTELLPGALILHGEGTSNKLLLEEGIEEVDSVVTLTGMDEINILISSYAKSVNVGKVITKVNKENYGTILDTIGLDSIISPKEVFTNNIIKHTRGMENTQDSEFKTLHRLVDNRVEALEFGISKPTNYTSIPLKNLKLKKDFLLASIIRENHVIIPSGNDTLEPFDSVVIVTTNSNVKDLSDILE